jgi:hypothetical protein
VRAGTDSRRSAGGGEGLYAALRLCPADEKEFPYDQWREYDPEDTMRFYAVRLHEAGIIKSSPQKIIAKGTDWHFLNELKTQLKGWERGGELFHLAPCSRHRVRQLLLGYITLQRVT